MMGMYIQPDDPRWYLGAWGAGGQSAYIGALDRDAWVDWVVMLVVNNQPINTGTNVAGNPARGRVQVWKNGTLVFTNDGPWQNENPSYDQAYFKMGLYNGWIDNATAQAADAAIGLTDRVVYHDEFRFYAQAIGGSVNGFTVVDPRSY